MPGTSGCPFFTPTHGGKGFVCQTSDYKGFGALAGGWEWESGNPLGFSSF